MQEEIQEKTIGKIKNKAENENNEKESDNKKLIGCFRKDFWVNLDGTLTNWIVNSFLDNFFKGNHSILHRCQIS